MARAASLWNLQPGRDNHWLDCLSGCCIVESILGGQVAPRLEGENVTKRIKMSELQKQRRAERAGIAPPTSDAEPEPSDNPLKKKKRIRLSDIQKQRRSQRRDM